MTDHLTNLGSESSLREVPGNRPLLLDDPETLWLVVAGWVDVFVRPMRDGTPAGPRVFLCHVEEGQLLCGVRADAPMSLLALGAPGSQVMPLSRTEFAQRAAAAVQRGQLEALVEKWTQGLTAGVMRGRLQPRDMTVLEPGQETSLPDGLVSAARGTLWIAHRGAEVWFLDEEPLPIDGDGLFPLAVPGWLSVRQEAALTGWPTEVVLRQSRWTAALDHFHGVVLACAARNAELALLAEGERLDLRAQTDLRLRQSTVTALATVTDRSATEDLQPRPNESPLLAVCRMAAAARGLVIRPPAINPEHDRRRDPVQAVAHASRLQVRRVRLTGDWWRCDNGPLLAFQTADDQPVALLPASASRYRLVYPGSVTSVPVTAATAATLRPIAYQFCRPFPPGPLTPRKLFQFGLVGSRRDWIMVGVLGLAGGVLALFPPLLTGWLFDAIIPGLQRTQLLVLVLVLLTTGLAGVLFRLARGVATMRVETVMDSDVQSALWDRLLNLPVPFFRQFTAGDLAARASGIGNIRWLLTDAALLAILNLVFSLVYIVALFAIHVQLALVACLLFLIVLTITCLAGFRELPYQRRIHALRGSISGLVLQLITGLSRIHTAGAEDRALSVWAREFSRQRRLQFRARYLTNGVAAFDAAVPLTTTLVLFGTAAWIPREELSLGMFLAFNVAFVRLLSSALSMSSTVSSLVEMVPLYERARPILHAVPENEEAQTLPGDLRGDIEISHVSFRYRADGPLILDDVSVHILPGEFVAFVGPSGAGKSTLLRLLLGFETPSTGALFFDREDLRRLDRQAVRQQIGVVLQNSRILPGTLFVNIVGSAPLTAADAWEAARLAGLDEDIQRMPLGMETVLAEGGGGLSGGQRQRLLIARAVVSRPRVLFFDEATSALDNETQARVSRSLENLKASRVVVAHRLSTIVHADRICVVDGGRIAQQGTYDELLRQGGLFAELVKRQMA